MHSSFYISIIYLCIYQSVFLFAMFCNLWFWCLEIIRICHGLPVPLVLAGNSWSTSLLIISKLPDSSGFTASKSFVFVFFWSNRIQRCSVFGFANIDGVVLTAWASNAHIRQQYITNKIKMNQHERKNETRKQIKLKTNQLMIEYMIL